MPSAVSTWWDITEVLHPFHARMYGDSPILVFLDLVEEYSYFDLAAQVGDILTVTEDGKSKRLLLIGATLKGRGLVELEFAEPPNEDI